LTEAARSTLPVPASDTAPVAAPSRPARRIRLLKSAGVRFGVIYAVLFGVSAIALAAFLWWSTAGLLERQTVAAINQDSETLIDRFLESGPTGAMAAIKDRIAGDIDDDSLYLLVDPDFNYIEGNLNAWPSHMPMDQDWDELKLDRAGVPALMQVHYFELPGGYHMLVGRDIAVRAQLGRMIGGALLWAAAIAVILGTIGAWAVRGLFRSTIADVSATALAVSAGDLTRRVRVAGADDEFDLLAQTINDMLDRISRLMDGVRQVSNAIAHDLRTPITRARTRLEDAAIHATTEVDLRAAVERAMADLDGIVGVFQALLRISEIEAGARRSAFAPVDLVPLLTDITEMYDAVADDAGMVLQTEIGDTLPAFGDRDMIQQAVANLLDNALKFSPPGGVIRVSAQMLSGVIRIEVADQGPGIPEPDRIRATERFFRGEQARSTPGSGLGLSLVQAVAHLHGGEIQLLDAEPDLRAVLTLAMTRQVANRPGHG
jgi:signal transduction histidine kinase